VSASSFTNDIDNHGGGNYKYDKTGNLVEDVSESTRIHWTYYNKVKQIDSVKLTPPKYGLVWATKLRMKYDALVNRVVKENPKRKVKEVYVRDAQGNILALYQVKNDSLYTKEFYMYGSNRLGYIEDDVFLGRRCIGKFCNIVANPVNPMPFIGTQKTSPTLPPVVIQPISSSSVGIVFGKKRYEISDWLGNVRVVINDRKTPVNSGNATVGYKAQVVSVSDYYSFGSEIADRSYDPVKPFYRFGFNTQEKTFELNRDHYTAKFWEYDARLGRRWNVDPKPTVGESEYAVNKNNPVLNNDPDGDCADCKVEGKASISITIGTNKQSRVNFAAAIGISQTKGNLMNAANLSLNLYTGGPGTTQASTGKSSLGAAITLGLSSTYGSGSGLATDLNIFNSTTLSGVKNTFEKSVTIGTNLTFNTATGFNRVAGLAGKIRGFTATINEDFSLFPGGGLLASGKDEGETGGGFLGYTFKNNTSLFVGTEIFTGKPIQYPKTESVEYPGYVEQTFRQQQLNVGRTFLKIENAPVIGNIRFDYSGKSQMWSQNIIHHMFGYYLFRSTAVNSFQITR
jgi:hypothetical protein